MENNYAKIVNHNLTQLFADTKHDIDSLSEFLPGKKEGNEVVFKAFGEKCRLGPEGIFLEDSKQTGVLGILISLYALWAKPDHLILEPFKSIKEVPNSMPYIGAFTTHCEHILIPHVSQINKKVDEIKNEMEGTNSPRGMQGDFSFVVYPLPKIALCYMFYLEDEEFPASVNCLFSQNADVLMPIDGLADTGEYTSKKIIEILKK